MIIPVAFLEACSISEEVDLRIEGKTRVIGALKKLRSGSLINMKQKRLMMLWIIYPLYLVAFLSLSFEIAVKILMHA